MKKIYFIIILVLPISIFSQENLNLNSNNLNIEFKISPTEFYIKHNSKSKKSLKQKLKTENITELSNNYALVKINNLLNKNNFSKQRIELVDKYQFEKIEPILIYKDGVKQACNEEIIIKVTNNFILKKLLKSYDYTLKENEFIENQFLLKIKGITTKEIFKLVKKLEENNEVIFAEPNFIRFLKPQTNDPFFNSQWSINNQGYLGGTIDADMDVEEAWSLATGSGIKVAVIDEGVDLTHPDLTANLLAGHDATDGNLNGAPNEINLDAHGTACAGIIAAVGNNTKGTVGVAYNTKIMPVRIGYSNGLPLSDPNRTWINNDSWTANGINWAVQNGADILSNSWGGGSPSTSITNAINNAVNNGRNGKGCIVLFASGNFNTNVSYPANLNNVIAVGASSMCDERKSPTSCDSEFWWGSNFGNEIDIVAPGVEIFTTDISGVNGYKTGDYTSNFNGTSSACPNAAGVAALVLSVNPNFTQTQVREILETTTDKIGNTPYNVTFQNYGATETWNNQVGYGRLNAFSAVQKAINYDNYNSHYITGRTQITPGTGGFYKIKNPFVYATNYVWSIPSGCTNNYCWNIVQGQGTSAALINGGSTGIYDITCKVYNGSTQIGNYYITVNVQNPYNGGGGNGDPCDGEIVVEPMVIYPPEPCDNVNMNVNSSVERVYFRKVVVYNIQGQKIIETNEKQEVDISSLSSGIYIIKAELSNNEIMTKKILRE
jgi:subtilisin family serine protease